MQEDDLLQKLNEDMEELSQMEEVDVLKDFDYDIFDRMKTNSVDSKETTPKHEADVAVDFNIAKKIAQAESEKVKAKAKATAKEVEAIIEKDKQLNKQKAAKLAEQLHNEKLKTERRAEESIAQSTKALEESAELARIESEKAELAMKAAAESIAREGATKIEVEQFEREKKEKERLESFTNAGKAFFKNIKESIEAAVKEDKKKYAEAKAENDAIGEIEDEFGFKMSKPSKAPVSRKERKTREMRKIEHVNFKDACKAFFAWVKHNHVVYWQSWKYIHAENRGKAKDRRDRIRAFVNKLKAKNKAAAAIRKAERAEIAEKKRVLAANKKKEAYRRHERKNNEKVIRARAEAIKNARYAREEAARNEQKKVLQNLRDEIKRLDKELKETTTRIEVERQIEIKRIEDERRGEVQNTVASLDLIEIERKAAIAKIEAENKAEKRRIEAELSTSLGKEEFEQKLAEAQFIADDAAQKRRLESDFKAEILRIDANKRLEELVKSEAEAKSAVNAKYDQEVVIAQQKAEEIKRIAEEEAKRQAAAAKEKEEQLARSNQKKSKLSRRLKNAYFTWAVVWDQLEEEKFLKKIDKQSKKNNKRTQKLNAKKIRENQCNENIGSKEN